MSDRSLLHRVKIVGDSPPERFVVFLHGILGSGANWAGFARRLVEARPDLGALLVDLRLHGRSASGSPPHTVHAAALDVVHALAEEGIDPIAVSGHSFGSKVAFLVAEELATPPETIWLLDADPGVRPAGAGRSLVLRVIAALRELPRRFESREAFTEQLVARGFAGSLAGWLGKNLVRVSDELHLEIDLDAIEEILEDFHSVDLWPRLEAGHPPVHAVVGGRSDVLSAGARERLEHASQAEILTLHELPTAGHWVHIDAPKGLLEAFLTVL